MLKPELTIVHSSNLVSHYKSLSTSDMRLNMGCHILMKDLMSSLRTRIAHNHACEAYASGGST